MDPYTKTETRLAMFFIILFSVGILIICIVAVSFMPKIKIYSEMTSCSIYLAIDTVINGDGNWGGFTNLRDTVGNVTNLLPAAVTQIQIYFPGDSWLTSSM